MLSGKIPIAFIDIDLDKLAHYNEYEGFYLGIGLHTNDRASKLFKLGGFFGYGFKDKHSKYGGDLTINVHKRSESAIRIDGYNTAVASGSVSFFDDKTQELNPDNFYQFLIKSMNGSPFLDSVSNQIATDLILVVKLKVWTKPEQSAFCTR